MRLSELFAENTHAVWARDRVAEGWHWGPFRDDIKKEHPSLIPYADLSDSEKQLDRNAALETVKTLISLGYHREGSEDAIALGGGDLEDKAQAVIKQFKNAALSLAGLRRLWEERLPIVWLKSVQIYRRAVDVALRLGEAFLAFDISEEGLRTFKGDLRLIQLQALALARTGATRRANAILDHLRLSGHQDEETLGILARTHKDFWLIAADPDERRNHLRTSYELYLDGYRRNGGYYSGINAAAMGLIYGEKATAQQIAKEVADVCVGMLSTLAQDSDERYWLEATLAEASLILGDLSKAEEYYRRGSEKSGQSSVVISRTRAQARLLLECISGHPNSLDHCFILPRIAVFSGHMFDQPARKVPRFPYTLEEEVRRAVRERLESKKVQVGYSSLACGGDLIFTEELLARGGEVNVVLPFHKDDFKRVSVDVFPGKDWVERFDRVLANAATVTVLNERGDANDGAAYEYCNHAIIGLALLKSRFLGMDVFPMVVWDGKIGDGRGGTQTFVEFWQDERKTRVEVIALPKAPLPPPVPVMEVTAVPVQTDDLTKPEFVLASVKQEIKAMIFADIVGYTKLSEVQIPSFVSNFLGKVAELMDSMNNPPIHRNTWGDAVCCVFDHVSDAGTFALNMRDLVRGTDWRQYGLPNGLNIRIALHAGPVFP
ncbi:MAG TPA: TRAFs-binding domain-containing protein, partial [Roseimicrobium sp.]|nr:TRAFs-binding domain-containing protein [Roseimicrobium sp.]